VTSETGFLAILLVLLQGLSLLALRGFVEGAVKHQWDKRIEDYKTEIRQRERAAMVAELISEWVSLPKDPKRLNQLVMEANLWLPEAIARDLNRTLRNEQSAKNAKELVIDIRRLLREETDSLTPEEIPHWLPEPQSPSLLPEKKSDVGQ
jgi:hypothetical protein